ncbi:MAG: histidine kinase [Pirellulaceae bacterium]|nr:hypothetical protein [Planctomycetales bacterium]
MVPNQGFFRRVIRRALWTLVPMLLLMFLAGAIPYWWDRQSHQLLFEQNTEHLLNLQQAIIEQEIRTVVSDVRYLARQQVLMDFLEDAAAVRGTLEGNYIKFAEEKGWYDQIRFLNLEGREEIRVNYHDGTPQAVAESDLQLKSDRYYFQDTLRLNDTETFISPLDLNVEHGTIERPLKPVIRFAVPVTDFHGDRRGVLVLNYLGDRLLRQLDNAAESFPGGCWLINERGYYIRGPRSEWEWNDVLGNDEHAFATDYPQAWQRASGRGPAQWLASEGLFTIRVIHTHVAAATRPHAAPDDVAVRAGPKLILVAFVPITVLRRDSDRLLRQLSWMGGLAAALLCVLSWVLAHAAEQRRGHLQQLTIARDQLRGLASRLITAQEEERRKLSRELHDDLGQILASVGMDIELAQNVSENERSQYLTQALQGVRLVSDKVRQTAADVRTSLLDDIGLRAAIQELLADFETRYQLRCHANLDVNDTVVSEDVSEHVYRIVQESLTNIVRHAGVREARLDVHIDATQIKLTVADEGSGIVRSSSERQGLGLIGIRERVALLRGTCEIRSAAGQGTEITVVVPLPQLRSVP